VRGHFCLLAAPTEQKTGKDDADTSGTDTDSEAIAVFDPAKALPSTVRAISNMSIPKLKAMTKAALLRGEYKMILGLVRVIPDGARIKQQTDCVIDHCDHVQNLRTCIYETKSRAQTALPSRRHEMERRWINYLIRYFFLITFNAYFRDEAPSHFSKSFGQWYKERPEIKNILEKYSEAEAEMESS
jgi:hypothetical protein